MATLPIKQSTRSLCFIVGLGSVLAGCGGSSTLPASAPANDSAAFSAYARTTNDGTGRLVIQIPPKAGESMVVSVKDGSSQHFDLTAGSRNCSKTGDGTQFVCRETIELAAGEQTIAIRLYDRTGGEGHVLSTATASVTIAKSGITPLSMVLDGVVARAVVLVDGSRDAKVPIGKPTSLPVTVEAFDAGGKLIVAPGKYSSPITVTDADLSVVSSFSAQGKVDSAKFAAPGDTASLFYNGNGGAMFRALLTPGIDGKSDPAGTGVMRAKGYPAIKEYPLGAGAGSQPQGLAVGPDGALWYPESSEAPASSSCLIIIASEPTCWDVGRMTTDHAATNYPLQLARSSGGDYGVIIPGNITAGPDGALWVTADDLGQIGRITTSGVTTAIYRTPGANGSGFSFPRGITAGPDGALWYADSGAGLIGRVTTGGTFTTYVYGGDPFGITTGPDKALWFTDAQGAIGRITTRGTIKEYSLSSSDSYPTGITTGPDGALWFTEYCGSRIGRITTSGKIHEIPLPAGANPWSIVTAPDGALWVTDQGAQNLARVTTDGSIVGFPMPSTQSTPYQIVVGPDGALWFTDARTNSIGRLP
jgi:virginiamycin B lyase